MASGEGKARFLRLLHEAQQSEKAVAIYAEADEQTYEVGFVEYADDSEVALLCLTPRGEPDGRLIVRTSDIFRVDVDGLYVRRLALLYQYREAVFDRDFKLRPESREGGIVNQLNRARLDNSIVNLVDRNDYGPTGFVREVTDECVELETIGSNGEPDGYSTLLLSGISRVHVGRRQDQVIEFLYRYNHELKRLLGG